MASTGRSGRALALAALPAGRSSRSTGRGGRRPVGSTSLAGLPAGSFVSGPAGRGRPARRRWRPCPRAVPPGSRSGGRRLRTGGAQRSGDDPGPERRVGGLLGGAPDASVVPPATTAPPVCDSAAPSSGRPRAASPCPAGPSGEDSTAPATPTPVRSSPGTTFSLVACFERLPLQRQGPGGVDPRLRDSRRGRQPAVHRRIAGQRRGHAEAGLGQAGGLAEARCCAGGQPGRDVGGQVLRPPSSPPS